VSTLPPTAHVLDRLGEDRVLEQITRTIVEGLRPRRIVLFGSRARGTATPDSDYDIMVELATELSGTERDALVNDLFDDAEPTIEAFVYTPEEVERWRDDVGMIMYDIVREGRVLYSRADVVDGATAIPVPPSARVSESRHGRPESLALWTSRASNDFDVMERLTESDSTAFDAVCFHAHQCAEKLLKACLVARGVRPPRTHSLPELIDACHRAGADLRRMRGRCRTLQKLYPRSRYPKEKEPTKSEAESVVAAARAVRGAVLPLLNSEA
jgi:HEPN domain-containing protein/predicted nucleotidyltransferase